MKKLLLVAALILTAGIANANAGVSFEISVGESHHHDKAYNRGGHGHGSGYSHGPRYIVRECERPRYIRRDRHPHWAYRPKPCCDRRFAHTH